MIDYLGTNTFFSHNRLKGISRSFYGTVRLTSLQSIKMIRGWCWCVWRGGPDGHGSVFNLFGVPHLCGFPCQGAGQLHQCVQVMRGLGFNLGTMLCVANVILLRTPSYIYLKRGNLWIAEGLYEFICTFKLSNIKRGWVFMQLTGERFGLFKSPMFGFTLQFVLPFNVHPSICVGARYSIYLP